MSPGSMKALGLSLMILGMVIFLAMPFVIIYYGPIGTGLVFVFTAVVAIGAVLFGRGNVQSRPGFVPPPESDVDTGLKEDIKPEPDPGTGYGYCPNCGAPLSAGDTFCGVCGRRLRWPSSAQSASSSWRYPWCRLS